MVYGERAGIERLRRFAVQRRAEAILFAGGILSPARQVVPRSSPWGLTPEDERFVHEFLESLGELGTFCAVIPGPNFQPMDEFYRLGIAGELEFPNVHVAHATLLEERDVAICGLGVTLSEETLMREDCYSRVRANFFLRPLRTSTKPRKILLLPEPPPGAVGWPEGNILIGEIIDGLRPSLCVVAGKTDRRGVQRIASTLVVNPGTLADGSAAWLDWNQRSDDQVEYLED